MSEQAKDVRRFSNISAAQLVKFIEATVGDENIEDFDVFINEKNAAIVCVNRVTSEGDEIGAAEIHYGGKR